ncbi:MAG: selenocysteine-specific translation elongation factor, partial [Pyrinomonadaceae bacterium]
MLSLIVGTAGHIDHGKSSLVQALTGKDPDRLPEEKRRGITIDLGFADLDLGDVRIGFVDVPGHERFVKNMLAGVHGIDAVALVIAADEGVMPQTREHFDICRLLGVKRGLVIISKTDAVEEELIALVRGEAEDLVAKSFLAGAPIVEASARTGKGLMELREILGKIAHELPARSSDQIMRLPIDRSFIMKGFGPVVTGTLIAGTIAEGQDVDLLPIGRRVRARGVQVHGNSVSRARSGQRTAVNLASLDGANIQRGMVLAESGRLRATQIMDVELNVLETASAGVRTRARLRVHIGSAEVLARVKVLNIRGEIPPGKTGFAQLRLESPVVALHDDRFIVRSYSPAETIAGGVVLDPYAMKHRGKELGKTQDHLRALKHPERVSKLVAFVQASEERGLKPTDLTARTGWTDIVLSDAMQHASRADAIVQANGVAVSTDSFGQFLSAAIEEVRLHHKQHPLSRGIARETLRERIFAHAAPEIFPAVISQLEKDGRLVSEKDLVRAREHTLELSDADVALREKIFQTYVKAGLESPSFDQVLTEAGVAAAQRTHARKILQLLIDDESLVRVQGEMFFHFKALQDLTRLLQKYASEHEPDRT